MCNKKVFNSEKQALKFGRGRVIGINSNSKSFKKSYRASRNGRVRAYYCSECKGFHLTKQKIEKEKTWKKSQLNTMSY